MKIIQVVPTLAYGDAVGNDVMALGKKLKELGYETGIYTENVDNRLEDGVADHISDMPPLEQRDIIIYHLAIGSRLNYLLQEYAGRKLIIYHNITPPDFFLQYSGNSFRLCNDGYKGLKHLAGIADYCLADSEYNKSDLIQAGFKCPIDVLPILIPFDDYKNQPDEKILKNRADGLTNILFTGRISPNKCQEDIIRLFYQYRKIYNPKSRLFLVGSHDGMELYDQRLKNYVDRLGLQNVYFTGHVRFDEILAYYRTADVFVCMSEHEGFCVPLVEAMYFKIPILAYDSSAIADTLGGCGILTDTKDPIINAGLLNRMLSDHKLRERLVHNEEERLRAYDPKVIGDKFEQYLKAFIGEE